MPAREFEIFESGDPHSTSWCCEELDRRNDWIGADPWFYRGDISDLYAKRQLISYLRKTYPGCVIRYRDTGRVVRI